MSYDPESLPDGMTEDELYIIYWDSSQWQALPSVLDSEANTVSAQISHFTQFAIAGKLPTAQTSTTTVEPSSETPLTTQPAEPFNWLPTGSIIAGLVVVVGLLVYFFVRRKRAAPRPF